MPTVASPAGKRVQLAPAAHFGSVKSLNEEARTVDVLLNTGAAMLRGGFFVEPYELELSMDRGHTRLDRVKSGRMPVLDDHGSSSIFSDKSSLDTVIGVFSGGKVTPEGLLVTARFDTSELAERRWQSLKAGVLVNFSAGVWLHALKDVTPEGAKRRRLRATDWEPFEGSLVAVGADWGAQVLRASAGGATSECVIETNPETEMDREKLIRAAVKKAGLSDEFAAKLVEEGVELTLAQERIIDELATRATKKPEPAGASAPAVSAATVVATATLAGDSTAQREEGARVERERQAGIRAACKKAGLDEAFATTLLDDPKVDLNAARAKILDRLAADSEKHDAGGHSGRQRTATQVGRTGREKFSGVVASALLNRFRPDRFKLADGAEEFRNASLLDVCRECLSAVGIAHRGLARMDIAKLAMQSTSDFPNIVADVANNALRRQYEEAPKTWEPITTVGSAADFKPLHRTQLSAAPSLDEVSEHGEFTHGALLDSGESYVVATYGKIVALTRKSIVNDSLDAFTRVPALFAQSAARKQSDVLWSRITANANMADGNALFSSTHANLGVQILTDETDLQELIGKLRSQTGQQGEKLSLGPKWLIVPVALELKARQLTATLTPAESGKANPYAPMLQVIVEPRLDATSAADWYIAGDKGQIDMLEVSYLDGVQVPRIETEVGFEVDGIQIKCAFDFGAGVLDWRGLVRSDATT